MNLRDTDDGLGARVSQHQLDRLMTQLEIVNTTKKNAIARAQRAEARVLEMERLRVSARVVLVKSNKAQVQKLRGTLASHRQMLQEDDELTGELLSKFDNSHATSASFLGCRQLQRETRALRYRLSELQFAQRTLTDAVLESRRDLESSSGRANGSELDLMETERVLFQEELSRCMRERQKVLNDIQHLQAEQRLLTGSSLSPEAARTKAARVARLSSKTRAAEEAKAQDTLNSQIQTLQAELEREETTAMEEAEEVERLEHDTAEMRQKLLQSKQRATLARQQQQEAEARGQMLLSASSSKQAEELVSLRRRKQQLQEDLERTTAELGVAEELVQGTKERAKAELQTLANGELRALKQDYEERKRTLAMAQKKGRAAHRLWEQLGKTQEGMGDVGSYRSSQLQGLKEQLVDVRQDMDQLRVEAQALARLPEDLLRGALTSATKTYTRRHDCVDKTTRSQFRQEMGLRRKYFNRAQCLLGRDKQICCRVRPTLSGEIKQSMRVTSESVSVGANVFEFDHVFDVRLSTEHVYAYMCANWVTSLLDAFSICLFLHGPTASGKTHTLLGRGGLAHLVLCGLLDGGMERAPNITYRCFLCVSEVSADGAIEERIRRTPVGSQEESIALLSGHLLRTRNCHIVVSWFVDSENHITQETRSSVFHMVEVDSEDTACLDSIVQLMVNKDNNADLRQSVSGSVFTLLASALGDKDTKLGLLTHIATAQGQETVDALTLGQRCQTDEVDIIVPRTRRKGR